MPRYEKIHTAPKTKGTPIPVTVNYRFKVGDKIQFRTESEGYMRQYKRQYIVGQIVYIHPENYYILVQTQHYRTSVNRAMFRAVKVV